MKVKKGTSEPEHPSTIIVRSSKGEREYWTGKSWADGLLHAKRYRRKEAEQKLKGKTGAFVITVGFRPPQGEKNERKRSGKSV